MRQRYLEHRSSKPLQRLCDIRFATLSGNSQSIEAHVLRLYRKLFERLPSGLDPGIARVFLIVRRISPM